jgi:Flp pilus assembly protein TadG
MEELLIGTSSFPQHWVSRMLARFLKNARGGVAPLMAVVAVPVMAAVGMAVDYSRVNAARTAFQVSLDATALMLSKDAATETKEALQTEATKTFNSLFSRSEVTDVNVTPLYTSAGGSKLTLNGTAVVHTNFLGVIGIDHVDIKSMSVSSWGNTRLRVALVLDNTGSMASDGKMDALKTASHNLLTQLQQAAVHLEDVYVSIVPFSKDVNFGSANYAQSWLRWDLWEKITEVAAAQGIRTGRAATHTVRFGRLPPITPGTVASPIATRTSTRRMMLRPSAARSIPPNNIRPVRPRWLD